MENKVKYTIVPCKSPDDGMMQVLFAKDVVYTNMMIIDNAALGVSIEPELADMIKIATEKNLEDVMKKVAVSSDCETIILNGFKISLDEVRSKYIDFAKEYGVYLCINVISKDPNLESNETLYLEYDIKDMSDEEWDETKKEINAVLKRNEKVVENKNTDPDNIIKALLGKEISEMMTNKLDELEVDIIEEYSYSNQDDEIVIQKLSDESIIIGDGVNEVLIGEKLINFLIASLQSIA